MGAWIFLNNAEFSKNKIYLTEEIMDINHILEMVKSEEISINAASKLLTNLPYEDLDFAKIDHHRKLRTGFGEVIFCQGKETEHIVEIFKKLASVNTDVLATRATPQQYQAVLKVCPKATYNKSGRLIILKEKIELIGEIAVCTAGTADISVAEEAVATIEFFGGKAVTYYDVGIAGIHRLFDKIDDISQANVVIAIAGMEGALAGVLAGLVDKPVIAVPTSIGYGASFQGLSALLTMLNSCADGISVVNIDNGYGAGYLATQINHLIEK